MEVKLSPIEVESWCELWGTPNEGEHFLDVVAVRLGVWWFHLPNIVVVIFPCLASVVGYPFTIEVGKETPMSQKIFEGASLRNGPRWIQIFGLEKKGQATCCLV